MFFRVIFIMLSLWTFSSAQMFQSVPEANATLIQKGDQKYYCPNCGMHLVKFYKTSHAHENNQYCSLHCLYEATKGKIPSDAKVVDIISLQFIDADKAFYVVGSSVRGTMTATSNYAFLNQKDAEEFTSRNGGKIVGFKEAYAIAAEDFPKEVVKKQEQNNEKSSMALKPTSSSKIVVPKDAKCPVCGMFVAKNPQWVAMIEFEAKSFYFDGVKDMMKYIFSEKKNFEKIYVSDYYKLNKLEAQKAFYVIGSNVYGPMGSELIPFANEKDALTFAHDHNGKKVVAYDEIDESLVKNL